MPTSIIFVDSHVANYQSLIDSFSEAAEVFILDVASDGLAQMAAYLQGRTGIDAIHVISHGRQGAVYLGSSVLDSGNLASYKSQLSSIGGALTESGDILLYGCNVAQGEAGLRFINSLAQYTAADVAASNDATGAAALGGDWTLEQTAGSIETSTLRGSGFNGLLAANTAPSFSARDGKLLANFGGGSGAPGSGEGAVVTVQSDGKLLVAGASGANTGYDFALARYNIDGSLDTSFDTDGKVTTSFNGNGQGRSVTLQTDGKILVAGSGTSTTGFGVGFALARYQIDGSLDMNFGTNGKVTTAMAIDPFSLSSGQSVAIQVDGKILLAGYSGSSPTSFALARYNADGSLDTSFDADGKVTASFNGSRINYGHKVMVQADGKILVAGSTYIDGYSRYDAAIARYNTDGSLDTSFDTDGKVTTASSSGGYFRGFAIQVDGKILAAGSDGMNFGLVRFNQNGSLDTSFDIDGKTNADFQGMVMGRGSSIAYSVTVQGDGKIIVAGTVAVDWGAINGSEFALARFNANGSLDTTFGTGGKVTTSLGGHDQGYSVAVQADGKILVSGLSYSGNVGVFAVARYNIDGSLDGAFGLPRNTLDSASAYVENSTAILLNTNVQIVDTELAAANNYNGATLTLSRHAGANDQDVFSAKSGGTLSTLTPSSYFALDSVTIGRVTTNSAGTLTLTFNANATQSLVNSAMQQVAYANRSDAPPSTVQIDWIFNDGNTGAQGTGGALSVTGSTTVQITAVNDPPVLVAPLSDQILAPGSSFSFTVPTGAFSDLDLETLSYSVRMSNGTGIPPWLSFNASSKTFSGTPTSTDAGTLDLQVTAKDSANVTVFDIFRVTVTSPLATLAGTSAGESFTSGPANDSIDGGAGIDTVMYGISRSNFALAKTSTGFTVTDNTGAAGIDALQNVERLKFSDGGIALDVGSAQSGGKTVLLLGAVLPDRLVFHSSKQALLGAAIDLFDQGYSLQTLAGAVLRLPIWDILTNKITPTNTDIATYLLTNVNGVVPDATTLENGVTALNTETDFATQGNFLWHLAESATNQTRIDLVGLAATGLFYAV
jgi:uncharacterized delta-60 repeat protein